MVCSRLLDITVLLIIVIITLSWTIAGATADDSEEEVPCPMPDKQSELNSFLWTINRDPPSYLFGSIHVPFTKVWNHIPLNTKEAFQRADQVYFELDLTDPETISSLSDCQLLPKGQKLSNVIPNDLFRRLKRHLQYVRSRMPRWMTADQRNRGLYADYLFNAITGNWEHKRPIWVMLMVNSLTENSVKTKGIPVLDLYLAQEAEKMAKRTGAIEDVEDHCIPLNELNFSQALFTLNQTLWQQEQHYRVGTATAAAPAYTTSDLIHHYNCGDLDTIIYSADSAQVPNIVNAESMPPHQVHTAQLINEYFHDELIYKRNQRMAKRVAQLLRDNPTQSFFFTFGAGHFLGNNTVIDKLIHKGFNVTYTTAGSDVYLGESYSRRELDPDLVAEVSSEPAQPAIHSPPYMDTFTNNKNNRQRHRNHRGRRKNRRREQGGGNPSPTDSDRLEMPHFNDLWVRLEATSFGPNSLFRRLQSPVPPTTPPPPPEYAMYNSTASSHSTQPTVILLLLLLLTTGLFSRTS